MGLAERRAAKEFETKTFVTLLAQIREAAAFDLPVEVRWDTLLVEDYAHLYDEGFTKVFFTPLLQALRGIAVDDMGRDALKSGLKKVVVQNTAEIYSPDPMVSFEQGVLTLDHQPHVNIDQVNERAERIQSVLEKAL